MLRPSIFLLATALLFPPMHTARAEIPTGAVDRAMAEAETALRQQEIQLAESRYRTVLLEGWMLLGALAVEDGDLDRALEAYEAAGTVAVARRRAEASLALVLLEMGNAKAAAEKLRALILRHPDDLASRRLLARALVALGDRAEAVRELEVAHASAPEDAELTFTLATGYIRQGEMESAAELFQVLAEARPIPQTWVLIGRIWRDFQEYERAQDALRRALAMDPDVRRANFYLGTLELQTAGWNSIDQAVEYFRSELRIAPDDLNAQFYLGMTLVTGRRPGEALEPLKKATQGGARFVDAHLFLGQSYLRLGRPEEAATALRRALELASEGSNYELRISIHYQLAQAERQLGNQEEASKHFDAARESSVDLTTTSRDRLNRYLYGESNTDSPPPPSLALQASALSSLSEAQRTALGDRVREHITRAYMNLGIMRTQAGQFRRAAALLQPAAELSPDFPQVHYALGIARFNAGLLEKAVEPLQAALEIQPDDALRRMLALARLESGDATGAAELLAADPGRAQEPSLQYAYGLALVRAGRTDEALEEFDRLLERHGEWAELHVVLGQAHAQDGNFPAAIEALEHALSLNPQVADARRVLGEIHMRRGELTPAREILAAELEVRPQDVRTRYLLATVLDLDRRGGEARELLRSLLETAPDHADARYLLGKILLAEGSASEAALQLEAAVRLAPEDPNIHYQLAQAYRKLGEVERSREQFQRYREVKAAERSGT